MSWTPEEAPEALAQAVREWLDDVTGAGLAFIVLEPYRGRRPAKSYLGVSIVSPVIGMGHGWETFSETEDPDSPPDTTRYLSTVAREANATITVRAYGSDAEAYIARIHHARYRSDLARAAREAGFVIVATGDVMRTPDMVGNEFEDRATIELRVGFDLAESVGIDVIEQVDMTLGVDAVRDDDQPAIESDFTVPPAND